MKRLRFFLGLIAGCTMVFPAKTAPAQTEVPLWPLFRMEVNENNKDVEVLWPLFDLEQSPKQDRCWFLLLNSYRYVHKYDEVTWNFLWPIGRWQYSDTDKWNGRLFPFFFGCNRDRRYAILFPELWYSRTKDEEYTIILLPWGRHAEKDGDFFNALTPLFWVREGERRSGALLPVAFWMIDNKDKYTFFVFPIFRDVDGDKKSTTGLVPWWMTRKGEKQFANLFPVIWQKTADKYDLFLALPLYYKIEDRKVFFPLYWDFEDTFLLVPFYGEGKLGRWRWQSVLPPVYVHWGDDDYSEHDVLWPLVEWGGGKDRTKRSFRPLYQYVRTPNYTQHAILLNLAAYGRGKDRRLDRVFPFYNFKQKGARHDLSVLWPIYREKIDEELADRRVLSILPMGLFDLREPARSWHALNLAWWGSGSNGDRHGFYPLYSYLEDGGETRFCLLDLWKPLDSRFFEWEEDLPIVPALTYLFKVEMRENGRQTWKMPLDLFRWSRSKVREGRTRRGLRIGTFFVFDLTQWGEEAHELHLLTFFWDSVNRFNYKHSQGLWPVYTYKRTKKGGVNASFLDPLWFWGEATGEEEHVSALLKIFDYRKKPNGDSRFNFIWRVYRRDKRGDEVSTEMFPFLYWKRSPDAKRFAFLWRLFAYEKKDGKRSIRLLFSPKIGL